MLILLSRRRGISENALACRLTTPGNVNQNRHRCQAWIDWVDSPRERLRLYHTQFSLRPQLRGWLASSIDEILSIHILT